MTATISDPHITLSNPDDLYDALDQRVTLDAFDLQGRLHGLDADGRFRLIDEQNFPSFDSEQWSQRLDLQVGGTGPGRLQDVDLSDRSPEHEFVKLSRRVCLIQRAEASEATGFLVGPDLILTAAHALMGTDGIFANPDEVTILFDQFVWNEKTGTRAHGDECKLRRIPFTNQPDVVASSILVDPKSRRVIDDNELDYVLVRLDRPIGLMFLPYSHRIRGWNNCRKANLRPGGKVFVVQHPLGGLQQFADGYVESDAPLSDFPTFFKYRTTTLNGSSGAPIVNEDRCVVGIHVGERSVDEQFGVSYQRIFADLQKKKVQLPGFLLKKALMDGIFGFSETEKARKPSGQDWRGDRLFDQTLFDRHTDSDDPSTDS